MQITRQGMSMRSPKHSLASPGAVAILAIFSLLLLGILSQKSSGDVSDLRSAVADRLALMPDVARHKWNTGTAIADPVREQRLIEAAVAKGRQFGLPDQMTRTAIEAQIIASKQMQADLIQSWRDQEQGTFTSVPNFIDETRPKIEEATDRLIRELGATIRVLRTCAAAAKLRHPPPGIVASELVWTIAVEGLIQAAGGPARHSCSPN